jgi:hypothetical protein
MKTKRTTAALLASALLAPLPPAQGGDLSPLEIDAARTIQCQNLVYANGKTSVCFADKFLATAARETGLRVAPAFKAVKLGSDAVFDSPFTVVSGEGSFRFDETERANLRRYLTCGGFLLASPGCSDKEWDRSFRAELKALFPDAALEPIPMSHPAFSTVFAISTLTLKGGKSTQVEGLTLDGRLVLVYSSAGLNDVANAKGCCCCGGDQIRESETVNVNLLLHALLN